MASQPFVCLSVEDRQARVLENINTSLSRLKEISEVEAKDELFVRNRWVKGKLREDVANIVLKDPLDVELLAILQSFEERQGYATPDIPYRMMPEKTAKDKMREWVEMTDDNGRMFVRVVDHRMDWMDRLLNLFGADSNATWYPEITTVVVGGKGYPAISARLHFPKEKIDDEIVATIMKEAKEYLSNLPPRVGWMAK